MTPAAEIAAAEADELARRYLRFALATARRCCPRGLRDEAESAALVGLAQAVRSWPDSGADKFATWAGRIVKRRAFDLLRTERRARPPGARAATADDCRALPDAARAAESDLEFEDLIAGLAPLDRRLLRRVFVEGHDVASASAAEGLHKTTGFRRYHAALARLRARGRAA